MIVEKNDLQLLNKKYQNMSVEHRFQSIYKDFDANDIMCTSSFGTFSAYLLKTLSSVAPNQLIHFIDTGNHFSETHHYRDKLTHLLDLRTEVITASSDIHRYTRKNETWKSNTTYCCYLKKIRPIEHVTSKHKVWLSGLMEWQSDHRSSLNIFDIRRGILKFFPLIDSSLEECNTFIEKNNLPRHLLVKRGYHSIGCTHCTKKGNNRAGRWQGSKKTECGLHL